ncbi:hypothetical protein TNCV_2648131 [Trichonephila clavipes]|nr:hypothetical protein TNCV_2648131 [Trichonephila clavipes]
MQEKNNSTQQEKTTQLGNMNETTQLSSKNETTQQERTTQLSSRNETTQLVNRNGTTQLCTAVDRLQPPAPPLQQNRLFLPTNVLSDVEKWCRTFDPCTARKSPQKTH